MRADYSFYLILDDHLCRPDAMLQLVEKVVAAGVTCIQLRMKQSSHETIIAVSKQLQNFLTPKKIPLIINDYVDLVLQTDADGVHIGQNDMPYADVRKIVGKKIIGLSIENLQQAQQYANCGADYFGVGPVFKTSTKLDAAKPVGLLQLAQIKQILKGPVVAVGGINQQTILSVLKTGVDGFAFVSAILCSPSPEEETKRLSKIIRDNYANI